MTLALSLESSGELGDTEENGREDVGELEVDSQVASTAPAMLKIQSEY